VSVAATTPVDRIVTGFMSAAYPDVGTSLDYSSWILLGGELIDASNVMTGLNVEVFSDALTASLGSATPTATLGVGVVGNYWSLGVDAFNALSENSTTVYTASLPFQVIVKAPQAYAYGVPLMDKPTVEESVTARQLIESFRNRMSPKAFEAFSRLAASESLGGMGLQRHYRHL